MTSKAMALRVGGSTERFYRIGVIKHFETSLREGCIGRVALAAAAATRRRG
jgi:hypothetical protein